MPGVHTAREKGVIGNKNQRNTKNLKAHGSTAQTHGSDGSGSS